MIITSKVFSYTSLLLFCLIWEITDLFWPSFVCLIPLNFILAAINISKSAPIANVEHGHNNSLNYIKPTVTISKLFPLFPFKKEDVAKVIFIFLIFFGLQNLFEQPVRNIGLDIFGKEKRAKVVDQNTYSDSNEEGEWEVSYQQAIFVVNELNFKAHYSKNDFDLDQKTYVVIEYLPINPNVNRFRRDFTYRPTSNFSKYLVLVISILFTFLPLYFYD